MWNRKELKEKAKSRFTQNYWMTVLAALILTLVIGGSASPSISSKNSINQFVSSNNASVTGVEEAVDEIREAADDIKEAVNDIDEDEGFDTSVTVNGQDILSVKGSGLNEENKEQINDAIDSIVESFEDKISSTDTVANLITTVVLPIIVFAIVISIIIAIVGVAVSIFLKNPLEAGGQHFFMENHEGKGTLSSFVVAFKSNYLNVVKTLFFRDLYTLLWTLLFIIPGIIKAYEYRMIPYLLAEDTGMDCQTAFEKSKEMMEGNKWKAFVLDLSFIGWYLLNILTCGLLGLLYINPYKYQTGAELYYALRDGGNKTEATDGGDYASYVEVE